LLLKSAKSPKSTSWVAQVYGTKFAHILLQSGLQSTNQFFVGSEVVGITEACNPLSLSFIDDDELI